MEVRTPTIVTHEFMTGCVGGCPFCCVVISLPSFPASGTREGRKKEVCEGFWWGAVDPKVTPLWSSTWSILTPLAVFKVMNPSRPALRSCPQSTSWSSDVRWAISLKALRSGVRSRKRPQDLFTPGSSSLCPGKRDSIAVSQPVALLGCSSLPPLLKFMSLFGRGH